MTATNDNTNTDTAAKAATDTKAAAKTRSVKVNYDNEKVAEGTGFIHPVSRKVISGTKAVSVPADDWTDQMIRDKTLTEVGK